MKMTKLGYFSEFLLFPPLVLVAALLAFRSSIPPQPVIWTIAYGAGLVGWTFFEYLLHRVLFHHAPILAPIHERHHHSPNELIGTPAWVSVLLGVIVFAIPAWATLGFDLGTALTAGLVTGYLCYVFVHYATHHWRPRRGGLSLPGTAASCAAPPFVSCRQFRRDDWILGSCFRHGDRGARAETRRCQRTASRRVRNADGRRPHPVG